ncbi:hypothetical protein L1887_15454 [Cichorium endivia]|nr:hypothetical protein L1887_15454 [Cichorium endivia]
MASSSSSCPSVPTFSSKGWEFHVFLSFRGEDTRKTFVDHLYTALVQKGIYTYKDDETLPRGESIGPSLMTAIEKSQIAVIIFSKNYADSSWCLDELEYIMKCKDTRGQNVMPVFYDVDPSEVRKQKRKYGEAFVKHELENNNKVSRLRKRIYIPSASSSPSLTSPLLLSPGTLSSATAINDSAFATGPPRRCCHRSIKKKLHGNPYRHRDLAAIVHRPAVYRLRQYIPSTDVYGSLLGMEFDFDERSTRLSRASLLGAKMVLM